MLELFQYTFDGRFFISLCRICRCPLYEKIILSERLYLETQDGSVRSLGTYIPP